METENRAKRAQILLTNDDGIQSPGLWAAAEALSKIGFVTVAAPRDQWSGAGRSLPVGTDGIIRVQQMTVGGQEWTVHAIGGTPAQTVLHGILEILPEPPDLVVSGINYGENLGTGITISGTVGAALEAAAWSIPAMAVSLQLGPEYHLTYSPEVDFSSAAHFAAFFARQMLGGRLPFDVDVLKVDIPTHATPETAWNLTRLARHRYYETVRPDRVNWEEQAALGYRQATDLADQPEDTDVYCVAVKGEVSVTPLSLDLTSRVDFRALEQTMRALGQ